MIESIEEILLSKHCERIESNMTLKDKDKESKMEVKLTGLPEKGLLITVPPEGKAHSGILNNTRGIKQSCDYLLLVENGNQVDICFIELKTQAKPDVHGVPQAAAEQILYTEPIWNYLVSMAKVHCQEKINWRPPYFAVIAKKYGRYGKQGTKSSPPKTFEYRDQTFKLIVSQSSIPLRMLCQTP